MSQGEQFKLQFGARPKGTSTDRIIETRTEIIDTKRIRIKPEHQSSQHVRDFQYPQEEIVRSTEKWNITRARGTGPDPPTLHGKQSRRAGVFTGAKVASSNEGRLGSI